MNHNPHETNDAENIKLFSAILPASKLLLTVVVSAVAVAAAAATAADEQLSLIAENSSDNSCPLSPYMSRAI